MKANAALNTSQVKLSETWRDPCTICLDRMRCRQKICLFTCTHAFHFRCIRSYVVDYHQWSCPMCRRQLTSEEGLEAVNVEEEMVDEVLLPVGSIEESDSDA